MLDDRRRRVLYRAQHRGMKEADVLIGGYAERELPAMRDAELSLFETFLDELDADIMDWVYGRKPTPEAYDALVKRMLDGHKPRV